MLDSAFKRQFKIILPDKTIDVNINPHASVLELKQMIQVKPTFVINAILQEPYIFNVGTHEILTPNNIMLQLHSIWSPST